MKQMLSKLFFIKTDNTDPYENLALEEYLTETVGVEECILYLWQNRRTVVIGKNQSCWKECHVSALEEDGGFLARRLSGGGAVYQDLGNLNFTFCVRKENYDVERQLEVVLRAVRRLGIEAQKSGRNDITVDGRKFSGNAFLRMGEQCYHHGTIMLEVNTEDLAKYLNVDRSKLATKGVESVRSRVACLSEFSARATVPNMAAALRAAFSEVYGMEPEDLAVQSLPHTAAEEIERMTKKFKSDEWRYGRKKPFDYELSRRFAWGDILLRLHVENGRVAALDLFSDAMDHALIESFSKALAGEEYSAKALSTAVLSAKPPADGLASAQEADEMRADFARLIREEI